LARARPLTAAAGLIWLASFPKSGNTWFRIFLANLDAAATGPADINRLGGLFRFAGSRQDFEAATMLDSGLLSHDDIDGLRAGVYARMADEAPGPRWMKVHDAYTLLSGGAPMLGRAARAAIYLVRDPRDVAVSLAHHNDIPIDAAIDRLNRTDFALCAATAGVESQLRQKLRGWSGHVASWLGQADVPVCLVRYEDLKVDPITHFARALAFAGRPADKDAVARAVRHADFAELQRQERENGFAERPPGAPPFFRAGKVGAWRGRLTAAQRSRLEDAHAATMDRLGYARG
jgi:aryl sulfotransferase